MANDSSRPSRNWLVALALPALVLLILFFKGFSREHVIFSNDCPLALVQAHAEHPFAAFTGYWVEYYWLGSEQPGGQPNLTQFLFTLLGPAIWGTEVGPVLFAKTYCPISLLILAFSAFVFFRSLNLTPKACIIGGLAAMLDTSAFSNGCWGLPPWCLARASLFLALAAMTSYARTQDWRRLILSGTGIGLAIMDGFDLGALFSLGFAAYSIFIIHAYKKPGEKVLPRSLVATAIAAVVAGIVSISALVTLVGTQISGVAGAQQDAASKQQRWEFATQWSLPKKEVLRFIIPGLFGYRMDTPEGGSYWGSVGENPALDEIRKAAAQGSPEQKQQMAQALANPSLYRYSGSGEYSGILVAIVGLWTVIQAFRSKSLISDPLARKQVYFWLGFAVISLLLAFGRYAPFYKLFYELPYVSTIRNPIKFTQLFHIGTLVVFAIGLNALFQASIANDSSSDSGWIAHLKNWFKTSDAGGKSIVKISAAAVAAATVGMLIYVAKESDLIDHLKSTGFSAEEAAKVASFSQTEVLLFVVFLATGLGLLITLISGYFSGRRIQAAFVTLFVFVAVDMGRANLPWIKYINYREKYASNELLEFLKAKPYEGRVAVLPQPQVPQLGTLLNAYSYQWLQHDFPYNGIQTLGIAQEPRRAQDKIDYTTALEPNLLRYWELTNTRYVLGIAHVDTPQGRIDILNALNTQLDPEKKRFRIAMRFDLAPGKGDQPFVVTRNDSGAYALYEFTGALPRAKVLHQSKVALDKEVILPQLNGREFNPAETVLISSASHQPLEGPSTTNSSASITSYTPKKVTIKVTTDKAGVLLLNDRYNPGWRVTVNGSPKEVLRANFIVRAVEVPAGESEVVFFFEPNAKPFFISLGSLAVALALLGSCHFLPGPVATAATPKGK